ncbi:monovalent cation/H+ antiporter subunit D family protein [Nonomuraea sp. NPDC049504]|uniref:monovalent cation/H+ antiporter subunit D family protein n=1 Tax=Nonomuraea sp. NPDC049504 TaxID=3154729 RepID=UPI003444D16B
MIANLPVLQALVPLACAPLCALLRRRSLAWLVFLVAALGSLACAAVLARQVAVHGPQHYAVGGWAPPYGIEFVIAGYNTPVLLVVSAAAVAVAVYSRGSARIEIDDRRAPQLYTFMCLALGGLLGLAATGDVFNAFVFLEISSLSTYALVALGRRRRALLAAFRYLVIGTVGATFVLVGIGLAYAVTGTLNMADLAVRLIAADGNRALYAAVVFLFVGLAVKAAAFPLHAWLPGAYGEAPSAVSMFLAATSTKVALYVVCRLTFTVFGAALVLGALPVGRVGLVAAGLAMVIGSAVACFQTDLKYLLAWSSVGQIGYMLAGISLGTAAGVSAAYLHLINHAVIKAALFAAAGLLLVRLGSVQLPALAGLGRRMPWTFAAIVIAGLGLVGVPPTGGFAGKWALASALIEEGQWPLLVAMLVSSLLALCYIGRIVEAAWFREPTPVAEPSRVPASMTAVVWVLAAVSVVFGLDAALPASLAESAAEALLNGGG